MLSDGTWDYSYDAVGNLTGKVNSTTGEAWTYGYGARKELVSVEERASVGGALEMRAEYKYDVYGNRIEKDVDPDGDGPAGVQVERYAYDGWDPAKGTPLGTENYDVWADLDGSGSLTTRYLHGDAVDQLFARVGSGELPAWYLTDHLGSVRGVTDGAGVLLDGIAYDAFGNVASETAPAAGGRYKWAGRELDVEAHIYNNRARYYDPATARWLTQDPLGYDAGDSNLYRYTHNKPTVLTDPSGLDEASDRAAYERWVEERLSPGQQNGAAQLRPRELSDLPSFAQWRATHRPRPGTAKEQYAADVAAAKAAADARFVGPLPRPVPTSMELEAQAQQRQAVMSFRKGEGSESQQLPNGQWVSTVQLGGPKDTKTATLYLDYDAKVTKRPPSLLDDGGMKFGPIETRVVGVKVQGGAKTIEQVVQAETEAYNAANVPGLGWRIVGYVVSGLEVVGGVVIFVAHPVLGGYLIYRGVEGIVSNATGKDRWSTQLGYAIDGKRGHS